MPENVAGFWRRFAAAFVDALVLGVVSAILRSILGWTGEGIGILIAFGYYTYFHGGTGQTPGDAVLGIRVLDIDDGTVIGYQRAFVRALVSVVSSIVIFVGYLWMLWDPRQQTWHDKAAGSVPFVVGR